MDNLLDFYYGDLRTVLPYVLMTYECSVRALLVLVRVQYGTRFLQDTVRYSYSIVPILRVPVPGTSPARTVPILVAKSVVLMVVKLGLRK